MDRRQKRTRDSIFKAFTMLLSEKDYNQITVQDIIDAANIGRTTFYSHFETKDYLLKELCEELFDHIIGSAMGHTGQTGGYFDCNAPDSVFLHLLQHLQKNDNNILDLLSCANNQMFLRYFKNGLQKLIRTRPECREILSSSVLPEDYLVNHIASSFVETVGWWIENRRQETPETITGYFLKAVGVA